MPLLRAGPWTGVRTTTEPYDDRPNELVSAKNCYIPDPETGSALYSRPGFTQSGSVAGAARVLDVFGFVSDQGRAYNVSISNGKLYNFRADLATLDDVTPQNVVISTTAKFVFCTAIGNTLIVSDGVNKPWTYDMVNGLGTLTATPIEWVTPTVYLSRGQGPGNDVKLSVLNWYIVRTGAGAGSVGLSGSPSTPLAAGTIPMNTWGIYRVEIGAAGAITVTAGSANFTTGYATEAAAIADVPLTHLSTLWNAGYVTVQTKVGTTFIGGTDGLFGGSSGNVANATNYYAGEGDPWAAFGNVEVYGGCLVFMASFLRGTSTRTTIGWSEPNQPTVGYAQTNYANWWILTQTGNTPLYALKATNAALFYARAGAWGRLTGQPSINFRNDASHDTVSYNIGTVSPKAVRLFGEYIYFLDAVGRPYRFAIGGAPEPLWLQMRSEYDVQAAGGNTLPATVGNYAWAEIEPNLNLYLAATWPRTAISPYSPVTIYAFDAHSGRYAGTWTMGGDRFMDVGGILLDANLLPSLYIGGQRPASTDSAYYWKLSRVSDNVWQDNGVTITCEAQTQRLGYSMPGIASATQVRCITALGVPHTASALTSNGYVALGSRSPAGAVILSRGSTDTRVASVAFSYVITNTGLTKAAVAAGTALPAGTIPMNTWGIYRASINAAGTIAIVGGAANATTGYATEAAAILGLPATPILSWDMGYLTVKTKVGTTFVAATDALLGGSSGNVASETNYYAGQMSADGIYRIVWTPELITGHGIQTTISPDTTLAQWQLFGVEIDTTEWNAPVDER